MAVSPTRPGQGPMKELGSVMSGSTEKARQTRMSSDRKVERQQVQGSRRSEEEAAAERARERRAEENRGRNVDVQA